MHMQAGISPLPIVPQIIANSILHFTFFPRNIILELVPHENTKRLLLFFTAAWSSAVQPCCLHLTSHLWMGLGGFLP